MSKRFLASVLGLLALLLAVGVTTAAADTPPGVQTAGQGATSGQQGAAASGATQTQPSNTNISVRVLSPGNGGSVNQTNSVSSTGTAKNDNSTTQNASQSGSGAGGIQTSNQSAGNAQLAQALSTAAQFGASNTNIDVRVGSGGNGGTVNQANTVSSDAKAKNDNDTRQTTDQSQTGGTSCGCSTTPAIQTADQKATNDQKAIALSAAVQKDPSNTNLPIRVGSPGNDGSVSQTNDVSSEAKAKNDNDLHQSTDQGTSGGTGTDVQTANQSAANEQGAAAASAAKQDKPKNVNISVRVLSPGDDGSVSQTNSVSSSAKAKNDNDTRQSIDQDPSAKSKDSRDRKDGNDCGCSGSDVQTATQGAESKQGALALSEAKQFGASNVNTPIRVGSYGNDGSVRQSNDVSSEAEAKNDNDLHQSVDQGPSAKSKDSRDGKDGHDCGCSGTDIQTADQWAGNAQLAAAASAAEQKGASNKNAPLRVGSSGNGGSVVQSNDVSSEAKASNDNDTRQSIDQDPSGKSKDSRDGKDGHDCGCSGTDVQTAKQGAKNLQGSFAVSKADQDFGRSKCGCQSDGNTNAPIRVGSPGNDDRVWQLNDVSSNAKAKNDNDLHQSIDQDQSGGSGTGAQTADQWAGNGQLAGAASFAKQDGASNKNAPLRVGSSGNGGSVTQSNDVSSEAKASNDNDTRQSIDQDPSEKSKDSRDGKDSRDCGCSESKDSRDGKDGRDCGCSGTEVQTAKQGAKNEQGAFSLSAAEQTSGAPSAAATQAATRTLRSASAAAVTTGASRSRTTSRRRRRHPTTTTCISRSIRISRRRARTVGMARMAMTVVARAPASRRLTSGPVTHSWPVLPRLPSRRARATRTLPSASAARATAVR